MVRLSGPARAGVVRHGAGAVVGALAVDLFFSEYHLPCYDDLVPVFCTAQGLASGVYRGFGGDRGLSVIERVVLYSGIANRVSLPDPADDAAFFLYCGYSGDIKKA